MTRNVLKAQTDGCFLFLSFVWKGRGRCGLGPSEAPMGHTAPPSLCLVIILHVRTDIRRRKKENSVSFGTKNRSWVRGPKICRPVFVFMFLLRSNYFFLLQVNCKLCVWELISRLSTLQSAGLKRGIEIRKYNLVQKLLETSSHTA
jgi:hypothetical protein